jgi:hypothetical protein
MYTQVMFKIEALYELENGGVVKQRNEMQMPSPNSFIFLCTQKVI